MTARTFTAADWLLTGLTDADLHDDEPILETELDDTPLVVERKRLTAADWRDFIVATVAILLLGVLLVWVCFPGRPDLAVAGWTLVLLPAVVVEWCVILLIAALRGQL